MSTGLFADSCGQMCGPDRERKAIFGAVIAQTGVFKSQRGRFTLDSLRKAVSLLRADALGTKSRFKHPNPMSPDPPFLGRFKQVRLDGEKIRADLHLNATTFKAPPGGGTPLGEYLLDLAETDAGALACSMVLLSDKIVERDLRGRALADASGPLPPIWNPTRISHIDIVGEGDATENFLSFPDPLDAELDAEIRARWRQTVRQSRRVDELRDEVIRLRWTWTKKKVAAGC